MSTTTVNVDAKMVKELRDKTGELSLASAIPAPFANGRTSGNPLLDDALSALINLGYKPAEAKRAANKQKLPMIGITDLCFCEYTSHGHCGPMTADGSTVQNDETVANLVKQAVNHARSGAQEALDREKDIQRARALEEGKPEKILDKIVEGRLAKFYEEVCLLDQPFIKEQTISVSQLIATKIGKLGENISVRRFARFKVGEQNWTIAQTKATSTEEAKQ